MTRPPHTAHAAPLRLLVRLYGLPHEALHLLALVLVARRALAFRQTHIDIPADLTTRQFVFVAGLPALVFWGGAAAAGLALVNAQDLMQAGLALLVMFGFMLGGAGTLGDLHLIIERLSRSGHGDG